MTYNDVIIYYTTVCVCKNDTHILSLRVWAHQDRNDFFVCLQTGWMMWNWLVSSLAVGASVVLYDGSPLVPSANVLWDLVDRLG